MGKTFLGLCHVASKIADALDVTLDYLLGKSDNMVLGRKNLQRFEDVESLLADEKKRIFHYIDLIIRDHKTSKAYAT